jgi:RNA polymerase sigma-70 factor (ECF subfamily)
LDADETQNLQDHTQAPAEEKVLLDQVYECIEALPEDHRTVMLLITVEGFSYKETAKILDLPIGTVMSRLARARQRICEKTI